MNEITDVWCGNIEEAERLREITKQKTALAIKELKGQTGQMRSFVL